jgi:hypothetical protein
VGCGESHEEDNHGKNRQPEPDLEAMPEETLGCSADVEAGPQEKPSDFLSDPKPHDFISTQLCEYHLERNGVARAATHEVNGDYMCERCFNGRPVLRDELEGDQGDPYSKKTCALYFQRHKQAIYARRKALRAERESRAAELS